MDKYSRLISVLKITLPLLALALLSTLFLFARSPGELADIPFAELEDIARQPRMSDPQYAGLSESGALLDLKAHQMKPLEGTRTHLTKPVGDILARSGTKYAFYSAEGLLDEQQGQIDLSGLVHLETDTGYRMETHEMQINMSQDLITAPNPLEVRSPFGTLTAARMVAQTGAGARMDFNGGVRLVYLPEKPVTEGSPQ